MNPQDELKRQNNDTIRKSEIALLPDGTYQELVDTVKKWMIVPDPNAIKFICAFYCANRITGKALWAFVIGPSGGGKTELLNSITIFDDVYPISILTPNTFLSGMPGAQDASLLPQVTGKILLFKDWTSVLSVQKDTKAELMSQLREIWDGDMTKVFGNGKVRRWTGKVSVLAASTQAVDLNQQQYTHLGERFLNYRMIMPDRKEVAMRALTNAPNQDLMAKEIQYAMYSFIKGLNLPKEITEPPQLPDEFKSQIVNLANFCTMARSGIIREEGMKKEVIFVPSAEMPTRISGQLAKLGSGIIIANGGKFEEADMEIIYKVALDSIPQTNKMVITEMAKMNGQTTAQIATALGYPTEPIKRYLENLAMLRVCTRQKNAGRPDQWTMEEEFVDIMRHYEHVQELSDEEQQARKAIDDDGVNDAEWDNI